MRIRRNRDELERRLGSERPQAPDEFVSRLAKGVTPAPIRRRSGWSVVLAASLTMLLTVALALTGGIGYAAGAAKDGTTAVTSLVTSSDQPGKSDESSGNAATSDEGSATSDEGSATSDESSATSDESSGKSGDGGSADPSNESGQAGAQNSADAGSGSQGGDKQAVCHVPPGNPDNAHTIVISVNAVQTHLDHGDSLGPCPEEPGPPDDQYEEKVLICHIPPGNPENAHTISVSVNAVPAHLAHGDTEGPCPVDGNED